MITENKNKLRPKSKSKILVLGLILSIVIGLFAPVFQVQAQEVCTTKGATGCTPAGCYIPKTGYADLSITTAGDCANASGKWETSAQMQGEIAARNQTDPTKLMCFDSKGVGTGASSYTDCKAQSTDNQWRTAGEQATATAPTPKQNTALGDALDSCISLSGGISVPGCIEGVVYILFVTIPSFLLSLAAKIFDFMASLTLSSYMYGLSFIQNIWTIVRDFSNIFFILILLYAAFEIILDLGHGSAKKIVASVILIALVVNFSLFFTKVVIDSSNITALIFYNRIDTSNIAPDNVGNASKTRVQEKSISGALASRFNVNKFFDGTLLASMSEVTVSYFNLTTLLTGSPTVKVQVNAISLISMMVVYGLVIYALTYAFFIVAMSFLGRMITLMMLMIISPFAFVTAAVPKFKGINTIGFDSWLKKLIETSFVAAVFMFILYIISEILKAKIFEDVADPTNKGVIATLIKLFIPAILIVILLLKGTKYAKSASGEFTESAIKGAKVVGALALGGAALGTALVGRKTVGSVAKSVQSSDTTRKNAMSFKETRDKWSKMNKVNPFAYLGLAGTALGGVGKAASAGVATGIHKIPGTGGKTIGQHIQDQDRGFAQKTHATHILDAKMQSEFGRAYGKDAKYKDLTEREQIIVKKEVEKDEISKFQYGKLFKDLEAPQAALVQTAYNTGQRAIDDGDGNTVRVDTAASVVGNEKLKSDYFVDMSKTNTAVGEFVQALRKGSYDIRNVPEMSAKSKGVSKLIVGVLAATAAGVRIGLKSGAGVDVGKGEKDFLTGLKSTISTALSNLKVNVNIEKGRGDDYSKEVKSVGH